MKADRNWEVGGKELESKIRTILSAVSFRQRNGFVEKNLFHCKDYRAIQIFRIVF